MSDRERKEWSPAHRQETNRVVGWACLAAGLGMVSFGGGLVQSVGIGVLSVGVWVLVPGLRPVIMNGASRVLDALPVGSDRPTNPEK